MRNEFDAVGRVAAEDGWVICALLARWGSLAAALLCLFGYAVPVPAYIVDPLVSGLPGAGQAVAARAAAGLLYLFAGWLIVEFARFRVELLAVAPSRL